VSESDIVRLICDYLAARRHFFWVKIRLPRFKKSADGWLFRRRPVHAMCGVPDVILIRLGGLFVGLEVKTDQGRMSPDQVEFAARTNAVGAEYHVVRSIDDVQALSL
jgi:hypothetical protein